MTNNVQSLISVCVGAERAQWLFNRLNVDASVVRDDAQHVSRGEIAQALNMVLFADLLDRVPEGASYVADVEKRGQKITFDHGALRTVDADCGELPRGYSAFARLLEPLGFFINGMYPLPRLKMTGRAFAHADFPEQIAQFFVSELHVSEFSPAFRHAVTRVVGESRDPLKTESKRLLKKLGAQKYLSLIEAMQLLPNVIECFGVQHNTIARDDYEILLNESAEMAWISTEGAAYNHVTDRVPDVFQLSDEQKAQGRSIKPTVEVSANGRVRQTAFKAAQVERVMRNADGTQALYTVPGSFYEFITRDRFVDGNGIEQLDLTFDSSNATGIFKMTDAGVAKAA